MSRFGAYFSMELYFFVGLYLLNYLEYRRSLTAAEPATLALTTACATPEPIFQWLCAGLPLGKVRVMHLPLFGMGHLCAKRP